MERVVMQHWRRYIVRYPDHVVLQVLVFVYKSLTTLLDSQPSNYTCRALGTDPSTRNLEAGFLRITLYYRFSRFVALWICDLATLG
jgi:hypothetical protein